MRSSKEVIFAVDQALTDFGMEMGPLATGDFAGLDVGNCRGFVGNRMFGPYRREAQFLVGWRIRKEHGHLEKTGVRLPILEDRLCELGIHGQKPRALSQ